MYIKRAIENTIQKALGQSKVVLLTGARQVGKSTAVRNILPSWAYYTLDDENTYRLSKEDPVLFFKDKKFPYIIDEVQYTPELFKLLKYEVDKENNKGLALLTGSQSYELMTTSSESLAGRVSIIEMSGLSLRELQCDSEHLPFIPTNEFLEKRKAVCKKSVNNLWDIIHRGDMPELQDSKRDWNWFYRDYIRTYLERDIRRIINIKNELKFRTFLVAIASRSANVLVYEEIANDVGVDVKTIQNWLSILNASGLIKIIQPFGKNFLKRSIKSSKVYFMDTGLLCYLAGWKTAESAENGAQSGAIFETFVLSQIVKSFQNSGEETSSIYYYRDKDKKEVDVVIESDNQIFAIEIKKGATIKSDWCKNFEKLEKVSPKKVLNKIIICRCNELLLLAENTYAIPIEMI